MDEPFTVGGERGMYPGDFPSARNVVNCRCTMVPISDTEWAAMNGRS
jgi:hypothetical protein